MLLLLFSRRKKRAATKKNEGNSRLLKSHRLRERLPKTRVELVPLFSDRRSKIKPKIDRVALLEDMRSKPLRSAPHVIRTHFARPADSSVCTRRERRRRFLFASGKAGKIKVREAHHNELSKIVCKG